MTEPGGMEDARDSFEDACLVDDGERKRIRRDIDAQFAAARTLSAQIALSLGLEASTLFDELARIPDNLLILLRSPEGWGALANYVAASLGKPPPNYEATVH